MVNNELLCYNMFIKKITNNLISFVILEYASYTSIHEHNLTFMVLQIRSTGGVEWNDAYFNWIN